MTIKEDLKNITSDRLSTEKNKELRAAWLKLTQKEKDRIVGTIKKDRQLELIKHGWFN